MFSDRQKLKTEENVLEGINRRGKEENRERKPPSAALWGQKHFVIILSSAKEVLKATEILEKI